MIPVLGKVMPTTRAGTPYICWSDMHMLTPIVGVDVGPLTDPCALESWKTPTVCGSGTNDIGITDVDA